MKKIIAGVALVGFAVVCFLYQGFSGPIALELQKKDERHRTIHRTLTKRSKSETKLYTEEYVVTLSCVFTEEHYTYSKGLAHVVSECRQKSDAIYTPLAREVVQTCVAQREGFTKIIIPITGMTLEDEYTFFVVPAENGAFYLNIPQDCVQFLNQFEAQLRTDSFMADLFLKEEVVHYNLIEAMIHCGLRIINEMGDAEPHVCAYRLQSLEDVDINYDIAEEKISCDDASE